MDYVSTIACYNGMCTKFSKAISVANSDVQEFVKVLSDLRGMRSAMELCTIELPEHFAKGVLSKCRDWEILRDELLKLNIADAAGFINIIDEKFPRYIKPTPQEEVGVVSTLPRIHIKIFASKRIYEEMCDLKIGEGSAVSDVAILKTGSDTCNVRYREIEVTVKFSTSFLARFIDDSSACKLEFGTSPYRDGMFDEQVVDSVCKIALVLSDSNPSRIMPHSDSYTILEKVKNAICPQKQMQFLAYK